MAEKKKKKTGLGAATDIFFQQQPDPAPEAGEKTAAPEPVYEYRRRKKRKDATGQKADYHRNTSTLAVRLPDDQAEQVRLLAKKAGMSVNAWLAQLIESHLDSTE